MACRFSRAAEADLAELADYIALDNPEAALRMIARIEQACRMLSDRPLLGRARPEIAADAHFWRVGRYLILYRPVADGVQVVRILHGARRLDDLDV
ncbi:type II toxin-antitoxin system RelE/ParE family toxin [Geminicoccus roseus]|uniref:type II toxin-antitoxin system RelE/ParE family toxin n=1 Tax=Geminicoccus roseus TaxID=404900 RepID=UPI00041B243C|nr:type II toxin-antitoxin system RelE/ParE family toxin [Geminicoccus roseus]